MQHTHNIETEIFKYLKGFLFNLFTLAVVIPSPAAFQPN